jgi:hypothetical protein
LKPETRVSDTIIVFDRISGDIFGFNTLEEYKTDVRIQLDPHYTASNQDVHDVQPGELCDDDNIVELDDFIDSLKIPDFNAE